VSKFEEVMRAIKRGEGTNSKRSHGINSSNAVAIALQQHKAKKSTSEEPTTYQFMLTKDSHLSLPGAKRYKVTEELPQ
jgi:hypothetical protein